MNKDVFDGFTVKVYFDEDGDYLTHFVEKPNISAFSDTPEKMSLYTLVAQKLQSTVPAGADISSNWCCA